MNINEIDPRLSTGAETEDGLVFANACEPPFRIFGLLRDEDGFIRMPREVAAQLNPSVETLNTHTSGGRARFKTNSRRVAVSAALRNPARMSMMALTGSLGMDVYADGKFAGLLMPPGRTEDRYTAVADLENTAMKEITLHFPLYSGVTALAIGLDRDSQVLPCGEYAVPAPAVWYGTSVTQGAAASRPGNLHAASLSRRFNMDYVDLGLAGRCRAETSIAEYIAGLNMCAFIYEGEGNAPSMEYFVGTHERLFLTVREKQPDLPVVIASRPLIHARPWELESRAVVEKTYENALRRGDRHVAFVDGEAAMTLFGDDGGLIDFWHPTDLGFACLAEAEGKALRELGFEEVQGRI